MGANQDDPWVIKGVSPATVAKRRNAIETSFRNHGIAVFPGFLKGDPDFEKYLAEIRWLFGRIYARHRRSLSHEDLGDIIADLATFDPKAGQIIADMGTQPNKLVSANRIKFSSYLARLLEYTLGESALLATPQAGDTLHLFMPGNSFHRYNLPIHQDYQYLMQSPRQVTLYIGMSYPHPDVGGLEYWPGSHRLGVLKSTYNDNSAFEVYDATRVLAGVISQSYFWMPGDIAIFDSLICHRSIPNTTLDRGRVVQIMRYSDLRVEAAEKLDWRSTTYPRRGVTFQEAFPEKFVPPDQRREEE